jgi:glyoxylase-like metal-dependent hydrolase (beta-lactamase superfamily II)/rhodanese-related sulfurtransferase
MIFEQIATGGCQSYLVGCADSCVAALIDPENSQIDRYVALAGRHGLRIRYAIDTHTHADHFSATRQLASQLGAKTVMHRRSAYPGVGLRVDDGELIALGTLRLRVLYTPGHTSDSMCLIVDDRVFTGDTLLIGGTGRTDLPSGDPQALYESLFGRVLKLDPALLVYPAHDYKGRGHSTIGAEIATNPRLQQREREAFVTMMKQLDLGMPTHLTEALRTNMSGGRTVAEMLAEAAASVSFMSLEELRRQVDEGPSDLVILDVRERDAYVAGHVQGARLLPRGQLELRVNEELPDPTQRVLAVCEFGRISTLAAATLHQMGFQRAIALDGGMKAWREAGYPLRAGAEP